MKYFIILIILFLSINCNKDSGSLTPPKINPFSGIWYVHFSGDIKGNVGFVVEDNGDFSSSFELMVDSSNHIFNLNGVIQTNGDVNAEFSGLGKGNFSGSFSETGGSGQYIMSTAYNGTWNANR